MKAKGKIIGKKVKVGNFELPADHTPFMKVSKGGSSCGTCKFLSSDKRHCGNKHFIEWMGSAKLPANIFDICSDWWEPSVEYMKRGGKIKKQKLDENPDRADKKRGHIEHLANSIQKLRGNVTRDMKSEDEKERLTALVVAIIDRTAERVGNEASSSEKGHFGVTGFRKKNVYIDGNTVTLKYKGKSGVLHEKSFSDEAIANALRSAIKNSPNKHVFTTSDGFKIKADRVNRYLDEYGISAKDLRGYHANKYIITKLEKQDVSDEEKQRQKVFNQAARASALKVGHGYGTLKKHYMIPELETTYVSYGKILDLGSFYSGGGCIK